MFKKEYNPERQALVRRAMRLTSIALAFSVAVRYGLGVFVSTAAAVVALAVGAAFVLWGGILIKRAFSHPHWDKAEYERQMRGSECDRR